MRMRHATTTAMHTTAHKQIRDTVSAAAGVQKAIAESICHSEQLEQQISTSQTELAAAQREKEDVLALLHFRRQQRRSAAEREGRLEVPNWRPDRAPADEMTLAG